MPVGLVIIVAVLTALGMPRSPLRPSVPDASRRARPLARPPADAAAVTR